MSDTGTLESSLTIRIDNTRPVEIWDPGRSLQALGKQFEEFLVSNGYDQTPANVELFISHHETGSTTGTILYPNRASRVPKLDRGFLDPSNMIGHNVTFAALGPE